MRRYCWIVTVLSACLPVCTASAAQLVNGDFEDGLNGWTVEGSVTADVTPDNDFAFFQENASGPKSRIFQVFNIPAGVDTLTFTYVLSWYQGRSTTEDWDDARHEDVGPQASPPASTGPVYRSDVQASSTSRAGFPRDSFSAFLLDPDTLQRLLPPPGEPPEAFDDFFFADNTGRVDYHAGYVSVSEPHDDGTQTVTLDVSSLTVGQSIRLEFGLAAGPDGYVTIAVVDDVIATCVADEGCDDGNPCTTDVCSQGACVNTPIPDCIPCTSPGDCSDDNECSDDICNAEGVCENPSSPAGSPCGDPGDTACDNPDTCDGVGACQDNAEPTTTECRPSANECDEAEFCDGVGSCPVDVFQPAGTGCGDASDTTCDNPDTCDGVGTCQDNAEPATTECRPAADPCDAAEFCTGADADCPGDAVVPDGTSCANNLFCDGQETCQAGICADGMEPCIDQPHCDEITDSCLACLRDDECDDGDPCTDDTCADTACVNTLSPDCGICGDLDHDGDVDGDDFAVFLATFGRSLGDPRYYEEADLDGDATVTLVDYQLWLACYRAFIGDPGGDVPQPGIFGDFDADRDVDLADFADLQLCISQHPGMSLPCVLKFDSNEDRIVDLVDFAQFTAVFIGP